MVLEFWTPEAEQLKRMTDERMAKRLGDDWRTFWNPPEEMYRLTAILGWPERCFLMTAGEPSLEEGMKNSWAGTMTEELYRDAWGTALMDAGRDLLKTYIADGRCDKKTAVQESLYLRGPGLGGVPNENMRGLYEALEGWRIGVGLNDCCVLIPDKSFGGWFESAEEGCEDKCSERKDCRPGVGCRFCQRSEDRGEMEGN